tara:strand:+ start:978 stop:2141 length:1164 start_codon:yes stop_codon:yes gene_type:complete
MSRLNVGNLFNENEDGAPVVSGISTFSSPNYFVPPSGSTAQRPSSPGEGMIRFNTDSGHLEYYTGTHWADVIVNNNELGGGTGSNTGTGVRGLFAGGYSPSPLGVHNVIQYITISTLGNAQDFGDLVSTASAPGGVASRTRGVVAGGGAAPTNAANNVISAITISSTGDATDFGDLVQKTRNQGSVGNQTRGIFAGGINASANADINVIQYITIASSGNSIDFGDISVAKEYLGGGQANSAVRGLFSGGYVGPATYVDAIEYVTISTTGNSQNFGDLTAGRWIKANLCNSTRAVFAGGYTDAGSNVIDFVTIASTGNAQDFGDMTSTRAAGNGCSSSTRGVLGGGGFPAVNTMESIEILSTGNSIDFGDLTHVNTYGTAFSNGHGGL